MLIYCMQVGKKHVKKFVGKSFSKRRRKRIRKADLDQSFKARFSAIIEAAEEIVRIEEPGKKRLVFVGQAMRSLFEAVRGLNQIDGTIPRRNVRYFVSPKMQSQYRVLASEKDIERFAEKFRNLGIVSSGITEYRVFDYRGTGITFQTIKYAIKKINPDAKILQVNQNKRGKLGLGIRKAQRIARPTEKDAEGILKGNKGLLDRTIYLAFQQKLHSYLAERLPRGKILG